MNPSTRHQLFALRSLVVLPGALVEGALAVALPWLVARASLGTTWLGLMSALLVAAALVGAIAAPVATRHWGSRRVVLAGAGVSAACLGVAAALWFVGFVASAFGVALIAIAADGMADVAFSARTPVMARLAKTPLMQFTSANWLWSVCGVAIGCALAGIAIGDSTLDSPLIAWLAAGLTVLALLVAIALALLMPRDASIINGMRGVPVGHARRGLWNQRSVLLIALISSISFLYGPVDNLLAPAHLASNDRGASAFGAYMAAGAVGMAVGLGLTQKVSTHRHGRDLLSIGMAGLVVQLAVLWWLPSDLTLAIAAFVAAAAFAPVLPMLESTALKAVASTHRTLLLATAGTTAALADLVGTAVFGALASAAGTATALGGAATLAMLSFLVASWMTRKVIAP